MIKLELSVEEVNVVLAGLGKLPLEASLGVFGKVKMSAEQQVKEQQDTPKGA